MKSKLILLACLLSFSLFAQPKVATSVNVTKNKLGAEFKLTLKTDVDTAAKVKFPEPKNFGALEVIQSYKIDTVKKGSRYELIKKYGLTQFDSGKYTIPRIPVLINGKPSYSDSLKVEVNDVKVDTLKQKMYDIKDITVVESPSGNWWIYVLIALAVIAGIAFLVYKFILKAQPKEKAEVIVYKTPIEKATTLLQQLESKELWQKGEIKHYYSELTDIARNYIEEEIHIPAMESTTSELIEGLRRAAKQKKLKLSNESVENLEKVLMQADLVKFAKVKPQDYEIEEDKKRISSTIVTIHKSIPEIVEEDEDALALWNEQQKELARLQKLKREKRKKIAIGISTFVVLVLGVFIYFVATKGFDYVKDNVLGHPTKELLEGEWVYSEYGSPSVKIETPNVLTRANDSNNKNPIFTNTQKFTHGSYDSNKFSIVLTTSKFKDTLKIPNLLNRLVDATADKFEKEFKAKNILVKNEEFKLKDDFTGMKTTGSMMLTAPESDEAEKFDYEMLTFVQDKGVQTILVIYRTEDKYAGKIIERMFNSVELEKNSAE